MAARFSASNRPSDEIDSSNDELSDAESEDASIRYEATSPVEYEPMTASTSPVPYASTSPSYTEQTSPVETTGVSPALPSAPNVETTEITAVVGATTTVKKRVPQDKASKLMRKALREKATRMKNDAHAKKQLEKSQKKIKKRADKNTLLRVKAAEKRRVKLANSTKSNSTNSPSTSMFETNANDAMEVDTQVPVFGVSSAMKGNIFPTNFEVENIALELEVKTLKRAADDREVVIEDFKARNVKLAQKVVEDSDMIDDAQLVHNQYDQAMQDSVDSEKEKIELRDAITRLVYSSHTHQTYLLGPPTCPVSLDTLFPGDQVCDFIGCKCNCMVKAAWAEKLVDAFKRDKRIKCPVCQVVILNLQYKSVEQAVNDFEWVAIRQLSGCETVEEALKRFNEREADEIKHGRSRIVEQERVKYELRLAAMNKMHQKKYDKLEATIAEETTESPIVISV